MNKVPCVYILASKRNGTLYIGVTSDLCKRVSQHRLASTKGFTAQYGVKNLVYYERHETMESAIEAEKKMKKWNREWKTRQIEKDNPQWKDLFEELCAH